MKPASSPPSRPWWRATPPDQLQAWMQVLANLVVVIGAAFVVWQVLELRADRRRESAMEYALLLQSESYADTALDLSTALQERASGEDPRLAFRNIQRLGDLFLSAVRCREARICDASTLDAAFRDDIAGFYALTYDNELVELSCRLGMGPADYAQPLRAYLNATRGPEEASVRGPSVSVCGKRRGTAVVR